MSVTVDSVLLGLLNQSYGLRTSDVREKNWQKGHLVSLLQRIEETAVLQECTVYLDLVGNRFNDLQVEDFKEIWTLLCRPKLQKVHLRFGYEVFIPYYNKSLAEMNPGETQCLDQRIVLETAWKTDMQRTMELFLQDNHARGLKRDKWIQNTDIRIANTAGWQKRFDDNNEDIVTLAVQEHLLATLLEEPDFVSLSYKILTPEKIKWCEVDGLLWIPTEHKLVMVEAKNYVDADALRKANTTFGLFKEYVEGVTSVTLTDSTCSKYSAFKRQMAVFQAMFGKDTPAIDKYLGGNSWQVSADFDAKVEARRNGWIIVSKHTASDFSVEVATVEI
ncbi:hypothetical protein B484DRAFT_446432 [Ochromonadaceae sp. CCMP2298]|nr:hypothetical protein B484DRAFT_446432 [Ochromonadaceae sp. CCMP2298]